MTTLLTGRLTGLVKGTLHPVAVTVHPVKQLESVGSCRVASTWSHSESSGTHASTGSRSESPGTQHFASTGISKSSHSEGLQPESAVSCRVASTGTHSEPSETLASTGSSPVFDFTSLYNSLSVACMGLFRLMVLSAAVQVSSVENNPFSFVPYTLLRDRVAVSAYIFYE